MELLSPVFFSGGGKVRLRLASDRLGVNVTKLYDWFSDKGRQLRAIAGDDALKRALLSAEKAPVEGTRLSIGERINVYHPDGARTRLRICGVRSGGFANAYTVIDLDEMKPYCLKENRALPGDERKKNLGLAREGEMSILLGPHPHLVTTHAAFNYRSRLYILTEYLPDESLDVRLKRGPIPLSEALEYAIQICRAMQHARATLPGFVHGDIKPGNCLIAPDGGLKLGDLGLSSANGIGEDEPEVRRADDEKETARSRRTRGWGGTTPYMAPEMFDREVGDRAHADVYALGVTLFEMICGTRPFSHASKSELIEMHRSAEPGLAELAANGAPVKLVALMRSCLAKSPAERPQDFADVETVLTRIAVDDLGVAPADHVLDTGQSPDPARLAMSFAALGKAGVALTAIDAAISSGGLSAELLAAKAMVLESTGHLDAAYEASTAALMLRADLFPVLFAHARVLIARGDLENAANYLTRAYAMEPNNCVVLNLLGDVCGRLGENDDAESYLHRSVMIDLDQPEAWIGFARLEMTKGNPDAAIRHARKALSIDPSHPESNLRLAEAYAANGEWMDAVKAYKDALRYNPRSRQIRKKFAAACLAMGGRSGKGVDMRLARLLLQSAKLLQADEASEAAADKFTNRLLASVESSETGAELLFFSDLTIAKLADGPGVPNPDHLLTTLDSARERAEAAGGLTYHVHNSFGRVFYHLDETDKCETVFANMIERFGPNESSYYYLGACAEIREDFAAALGYYRKAYAMLNREDFRTGIQRVSHHLEKLRTGTAPIH